jgi:hypothetical protein
MDAVKGVGAKVSDFFGNMFGTSAPAVAAQTEKAVGPLPDGSALGTTNDARGPGYTSAGGRRLSKMKKTRRGGKRHRKTHKSRKH